MVLWLAIPAAGLLALAAFIFWIHSVPLGTKRQDALIILGYQCENNQIHPLLKERLDTALELEKKQRFPVIFLSGGAMASDRTEADIMKQYLIQHGVNPAKIVLEDQSLDTIQNLVNCRSLMQKLGLETCVILSNSFHLRRIRYIARALGMKATFYADRTLRALSRQLYPTMNELRTFRITARLLKDTFRGQLS